MSVKISIPGSAFDADNVVMRTSFNSIRSGLAFEFIPGISANLSVKNAVPGGVDASVIGYPVFNANSVRTGPDKGMRMPLASTDDETLVIVTEKIAGQNLGISSFNSAGYRELGVHANQLIVVGGGGNRIIQSIASHALLVPYFAAATFVKSTGTYKLFWGKAGVLNASAEVVGGTIPAPVSTQVLSIGYPSGLGYSDDNNVYYVAKYSAIVSDADMLKMYNDARARFLPLNADF